MSDPERFDRPFLSPSEWHIYLVLAVSPRPLSVREIVLAIPVTRRFQANMASVSALLERLGRAGYVSGETGPPARYTAAVALEAPFQQHADRMIRDLTQMRPEQLEQLASILTRLRQKARPRRRRRS